MYQKKVTKDEEFKCEHIEFFVDGFDINNDIDVCMFIELSQEEINSGDDYSFNGIFFVGSDLIDLLRSYENGSKRL